jgi:hypothetical protein
MVDPETIAVCFKQTGVSYRTREESVPMETLTSSDGTTIAFDRLGDGPPVIVVGGQLCDRALTRPTAEELAKRFTVFNYDRRGRQRRHLAVRSRAGGRRHRRADRRGQREGFGLRPFLRRRPRPPRGGGSADLQARPARAALQPRGRQVPATRYAKGSRTHQDPAGRRPPRRRARVLLEVHRDAAGDG